MKKLGLRISCWITGHNWTSMSLEGILPSGEELTAEGFKDYLKTYCKDCGHKSK